MVKKKCNRCGTHTRTKYGGSLELRRGTVQIQAWLCGDCYVDIVDAYENGESNA